MIASMKANMMWPPSKTGNGNKLTNARENVIKMMSDMPPRSPSLFSVPHRRALMPTTPLMCFTFTCDLLVFVPLILDVIGLNSNESVFAVWLKTSVNCLHGDKWTMAFGGVSSSWTPMR